MAGPCACRNTFLNLNPTSKYELTGASLTESSSIPTPTPVVTHAPIPALATTHAAAGSLDNKLFKQFKKAYLEAQVQSRPEVDPEPCKQLLYARFSDFYYGNSHMDCYQFCQQCEDYFKTTKAKGLNRIPFAALFLDGSVTQQWFQHKQYRDGAIPMT